MASNNCNQLRLHHRETSSDCTWPAPAPVKRRWTRPAMKENWKRNRNRDRNKTETKTKPKSKQVQTERSVKRTQNGGKKRYFILPLIVKIAHFIAFKVFLGCQSSSSSSSSSSRRCHRWESLHVPAPCRVWHEARGTRQAMREGKATQQKQGSQILTETVRD